MPPNLQKRACLTFQSLKLRGKLFTADIFFINQPDSFSLVAGFDSVYFLLTVVRDALNGGFGGILGVMILEAL